MARKIYLKGGIGIGGFRKIYGCTKNNGASKSHFSKSSGAIARSVLKNLEKLGFVEHDANGYVFLDPIFKTYKLTPSIEEEKSPTKDKETSIKLPDLWLLTKSNIYESIPIKVI